MLFLYPIMPRIDVEIAKSFRVSDVKTIVWLTIATIHAKASGSSKVRNLRDSSMSSEDIRTIATANDSMMQMARLRHVKTVKTRLRAFWITGLGPAALSLLVLFGGTVQRSHRLCFFGVRQDANPKHMDTRLPHAAPCQVHPRSKTTAAQRSRNKSEGAEHVGYFYS